MRKWIPAFLILAGFVFAGLAFERLPERVAPHWGVLIPWAEAAPPEPMPRAFAAFGLPGLALLVWLLLRGVASPAGERVGRRVFPAWFLSPRTGAQAVERFGATFDVIVLVVVTFILLFHAVTLGTVLGWPAWTAQVFAALVGVGMAVVGNIMPRTRPNWVAGLRTRRTLADPDVWRRTHRWFGGLLMASGVAVVAVALVSAPAALVTAVVGALASALGATIVGGRGSASGSPDRTAAILWIALMGFPGAAQANQVPPRGVVGRMPVALRAQSDAGVFRLYQGQAEIGREVFRIDARAIESTVTFPMGGVRIQSRVEYGTDGRAESASMAVMGLSGDAVRQSYSARRAGDSLRLSMSGAANRTWVKRSDAETIAPDQSLAPFLRLVMAEPGRARDVRVWSPNADSTIVVTLSWRGDTAEVAIGPQRMAFVVGADGRVVRGTISPGAFRYERHVGDPTQLPPLAGLTRPTPDYSAPADAPFTATDVQVPVRSAQGDTFALACTFTVPRAGGPRWPAVVTSTGSGQQDRDQTLWPLQPEYRLFRQVAERLAREEIAVLRCDDRGVGGSGGPLMSATTEDFAGDVAAQLAWLRSRADVDGRRIAIVGHSEGGLIGPMVAVRDTQLAAIVVLAGSAKPGRDVLRDQFVGRVEADTTMAPAQRDAAIASAGQAMEAFIAANAWTKWFADYDPRVTARHVRQPVLILHPALDQQVSVGQADSLAAALRAGGNRDVTVRIFADLNHLFLRSPAGTGDTHEYAALKDVVVPAEVLDALATWLRSRLYR